jgi:hypothetical protein
MPPGAVTGGSADARAAESSWQTVGVYGMDVPGIVEAAARQGNPEHAAAHRVAQRHNASSFVGGTSPKALRWKSDGLEELNSRLTLQARPYRADPNDVAC